MKRRKICSLGVVVFVCFGVTLGTTASGQLLEEKIKFQGTDYTFDEMADWTYDLGVFVRSFQTSSREINSSVSAQASQFTSSAGFTPGGVTFRWDPELGGLVLSDTGLGTVFMEKAPTVGRHKFALGLSWSSVDYNQFQDIHLDERLDFTVADPDLELDYAIMNYDLDIQTDVSALTGVFGLTDRWDIGLVVPYVWQDIDATVTVMDPATHEPFPDSTLDLSHSEEGLGDIILRTKYAIVDHWKSKNPFTWSLLADLKTSTGDENDLLGTGKTDYIARSLMTKQFGKFVGHLNLGYRYSGLDSDYHAFEYATGIEFVPLSRLTLLTEYVGRMSRAVDESQLGVGAKVTLYKNMVLDAAIRFPIDDDEALVGDYSYALGLEYRF
jgi:hypothetical protein